MKIDRRTGELTRIGWRFIIRLSDSLKSPITFVTAFALVISAIGLLNTTNPITIVNRIGFAILWIATILFAGFIVYLLNGTKKIRRIDLMGRGAIPHNHSLILWWLWKLPPTG